MPPNRQPQKSRIRLANRLVHNSPERDSSTNVATMLDGAGKKRWSIQPRRAETSPNARSQGGGRKPIKRSPGPGDKPRLRPSPFSSRGARRPPPRTPAAGPATEGRSGARATAATTPSSADLVFLPAGTVDLVAQIAPDAEHERAVRRVLAQRQHVARPRERYLDQRLMRPGC